MSKSIGLYFHIPFCKKKCNYCDFYSVVDKEYLVDYYLQSIANEVNKKFFEYSISTIYFGGGTPSLLTEKQIKLLFRFLKNFDLLNVKEITFEVNPESFSKEKLEILYECVENIKKNVLRISVGIQSFDDDVLKIAGRIHKVKDNYKILELLNKYNVNNFNIDLIFGFKEQNLKSIEFDLLETINFSPTHISCYALTIEENSILGKNKYKLDYDFQAEVYDFIVEKLCEKGYNRYEISNFAKIGFESKHNLNYWNYGEYMCFGCSAVSFFDNKRTKNICSVDVYIKNNFLYETEILSEEQQIKEKIMLGLRTSKGIKYDDFLFNRYKDVVKYNLEKNYLVYNDGCLKINDKYFFISNQIIGSFF